jgi:serine/threonine protein kinase
VLFEIESFNAECLSVILVSCLVSANRQAAGTRLGPHEIVAPIGGGGMGEVYRAKDTRLDRTVAIKILPEHLSSNPRRHERFEREARAISALNHPHICTLHDIGHQDGIDYLVMEYVQGETLVRCGNPKTQGINFFKGNENLNGWPRTSTEAGRRG